MFPASNSPVNPLLPHPSSSSFLGLNGNQILLHHYQNQLTTHHLATSMSLSANNINCQGHCDSLTTFPSKKKPMKRDKHSKILTAQGPRDRRVRLSIAIARKFFDLQDTLGFDKPSKTLDWLFSNSKIAIDELTQTNPSKISKNSSTPSPTSECEDNMVTTPTHETTQRKPQRGKPRKHTVNVLAKETRAKARARARERTIKKMWNQIEAGQRLVAIKQMEEQNCYDNKLQASEADFKEVIHGSELTKGKIIKPSSIFTFSPNLSAPKESASCSSNNENWDMSNAIMCSTHECAAMTTISSSSQGRWKSRESWSSSQI